MRGDWHGDLLKKMIAKGRQECDDKAIDVELRANLEEGTMPNSVDRTGAIPALTGIRFFAALMVFFSHYVVPGSSGFLLTAQNSGYAGVTFFFILSGFILAYNYFAKFEREPTSSVGSFYFARFSRVYPLYAFVLLYFWLTSTNSYSVIPHVLAIQAWYDDAFFAMGFNSVAWSISVEAFLYLMFPLIIPVLTLLGVTTSCKRLVALIVLLVVAAFVAASYFWLSGKGALTNIDPDSAHRWLYRTPLTRLFDFTLGICAAIYYVRFWKGALASLKVWSLLTPASILVLIVIMSSDRVYLSSFSWDAAYIIPFTLIIFGVAATPASALSRFLSLPSVVLLGEASFAFYMIHLAMKPLFALRVSANMFEGMAMQLVLLSIVVATSIGLHLLIEKPAQSFLRSTIKSRNKSLLRTKQL
ncbi:acyltransferase [Pseudomonas sp. B21-040]|uniref:acyltransferase family protein n=1 Tax=Pseudomonas sp. B21-040 TaxID=2895486 RepID=UPI00215EEF8D|nr:acyltransferase [Pseudomonas sp. B21-040]UVL42557.1 acyltransferase [Pseudomonas sp. B21-040]